jgi:hypothetical protein
VPGVDFRGLDKAVTLQKNLERPRPNLVIACRQIIRRRDIFAGVAALIDIPATEGAAG